MKILLKLKKCQWIFLAFRSTIRNFNLHLRVPLQGLDYLVPKFRQYVFSLACLPLVCHVIYGIRDFVFQSTWSYGFHLRLHLISFSCLVAYFHHLKRLEVLNNFSLISFRPIKV